MILKIKKSKPISPLSIEVPPSKSHSMRAIVLASMAEAPSEIKNLLIHLDIEIPDYIKKENLSSDDFWGNCKDLLSFEIVSLELGKTILEPNILGYVSKYDYYELRGVLKVSLKDDKAKETLLTLQEQFEDQNQTLLELTEFERNIKG